MSMLMSPTMLVISYKRAYVTQHFAGQLSGADAACPRRLLAHERFGCGGEPLENLCQVSGIQLTGLLQILGERASGHLGS